MSFYDFEHPFDVEFDNLSDYAFEPDDSEDEGSDDEGEEADPPSPRDPHQVFPGSTMWNSGILYPSLDTLTGEDFDLAAEVISFPSRLTARQEAAELRYALHAAEGGVYDESFAPPMLIGDMRTFPVPAERPQRTAIEALAVEHLLRMTAVWLASVDVESVPTERVGAIIDLAGEVASAVYRFPHPDRVWTAMRAQMIPGASMTDVRAAVHSELELSAPSPPLAELLPPRPSTRRDHRGETPQGPRPQSNRVTRSRGRH
jgi:hypothetical protein